jgi:hypothetical protein
MGPELDVPAFRTEVERRHGPLQKEQRDADPFRTPESTQPYVLFLIRPDGILSYYHAERALRGYQIDFGYELVDADWKLDVPTAAQVAQLAIEEPKVVAGGNSKVPGSRGGHPPGAAKGNVSSDAKENGPRKGALGASGAAALGAPVPDVPIPGARMTQPAGAAQERDDAPRQAASKLEAESNRGKPVTQSAGLFEKDRGLSAGGARGNPALGSRDFVIDVACYRDGVVVTPGGGAFNFAKAADAARIDEAVVRNIVGLITSRQRTVRPGEAAYRPVLRFVVHPEGLRSMYRVYPLLERLGVAMIRENVEE